MCLVVWNIAKNIFKNFTKKKKLKHTKSDTIYRMEPFKSSRTILKLRLYYQVAIINYQNKAICKLLNLNHVFYIYYLYLLHFI